MPESKDENISHNINKDPLVLPGRSVFVHLFEWKWTDIALEAERYLAAHGYAGVQISPPNEHALIKNPFRPWYERYQPVSYKLQSRSGNEQQFIDMVERCNKVGIRIYVDAVINHMSATSGRGTAGSKCTVVEETLKYPGVPYGENDFHDDKCITESGKIENFNDIKQLRECRLEGLPDLNTSSEYVRNKICEYMNHCIDIGVAGFRIDGAKHMLSEDLKAIYENLKDVRVDVFGPNKRPFIYQEVIDKDNEAEPVKNTDYSWLGRVTEFKYGMHLSKVLLKHEGYKMSCLKTFETDWNLLASQDAVVFIDNHDNQRCHGGGGDILMYQEAKLYKIANAFMLAWPYGFVQIMSSFAFDKAKNWSGPPSNENGDTQDVLFDENGRCTNGWICEHRWTQIVNMVKFRNVSGDEPVCNWWDNGENQIAFSRGNRAFIAINNENFEMKGTFQTGLPAGTYFDIISEGANSKKIQVNEDGTTYLSIENDENPIVAIHIESKI